MYSFSYDLNGSEFFKNDLKFRQFAIAKQSTKKAVLSKWFLVVGNIIELVGRKDWVFLSARRFLGNSSVKQAANDCF